MRRPDVSPGALGCHARPTPPANRTGGPTIALAGNPNTGKSTIFNALTGSRQHVANWPGKTVEQKAGTWRHNGHEHQVVDLPGTYSLSAYSIEEVIARDYIVEENPDVVVVVADAANLERNLYLVVQILESGAEVIVALNMTDVAASRGFEIDVARLARQLRAPVVPTSASKGRGLNELGDAIVAVARTNGNGHGAGRSVREISHPEIASAAAPFRIDYGRDLEQEIGVLQALVETNVSLSARYSPRWLAIKLLEEDVHLVAKVAGTPGTDELLARLRESTGRLEAICGDEVDTLIADRRYGWINGLVRMTVRRPAIDRPRVSDRIDDVVTHRVLGIPIFLAAMWAVFRLTADVSAPYLDWITFVISGPLTNWVAGLLGLAGLTGTWVESLFVDGIIAGVGGVMAFVPVLMSLYLALAVLEDSGYMARAAFVMERLMRVLGLHGKSFLPMLVGFGCNVPAIYATRTLESERDRILTGLLVPFMSCGARLPVYILFAAVFFPGQAGPIVSAMYLTGIVTAVVLGIVLERTLFKSKEQMPFVMELPPYRMPTPRGIWVHMWERTSAFVRKAWTIILAASIAIWFLMAVPLGGEGSFADTDVNASAFSWVAGAVAPAFAPLGFDSWQASGALVSGLVAKEVVVSSLAQVYRADDAAADAESTTLTQDIALIVTSFAAATVDTIKSIPLIVGIDLFGDENDAPAPTGLMVAVRAGFEETSRGHGKLAALAFMVFVLLYTPCMVAIAAARQEFGAKWMWTSVLGQLALAWLGAFAIFQGGKLLGLG